mmetsp:Transcript_80164/g.142011  ORF Transcript_80164/g.142011 Transcript_80164/m.142011 type:complete len:111 (-) Transcript_80164:2254-2586(-)
MALLFYILPTNKFAKMEDASTLPALEALAQIIWFMHDLPVPYIHPLVQLIQSTRLLHRAGRVEAVNITETAEEEEDQLPKMKSNLVVRRTRRSLGTVHCGWMVLETASHD